MENLRTSKNAREFASIFAQIFKEQKEILIWQNQDDERVICKGTIEELNLKNRAITISPTDKEAAFPFTKDFTLFIRSEHRSVLFKVENAYVSDSYLILTFPEEFKVIESRAEKRIIFKEEHRMAMAYSKSRLYDSGEQKFESHILDLSSGGLSFSITHINREKFEIGDKILISRFSLDKFNEPVEAVVKYIRKTKSQNGFVGTHQVYKVGVQFSIPMQLTSLLSLTVLKS